MKKYLKWIASILIALCAMTFARAQNPHLPGPPPGVPIDIGGSILVDINQHWGTQGQSGSWVGDWFASYLYMVPNANVTIAQNGSMLIGGYSGNIQSILTTYSAAQSVALQMGVNVGALGVQGTGTASQSFTYNFGSGVSYTVSATPSGDIVISYTITIVVPGGKGMTWSSQVATSITQQYATAWEHRAAMLAAQGGGSLPLTLMVLPGGDGSVTPTSNIPGVEDIPEGNVIVGPAQPLY